MDGEAGGTWIGLNESGGIVILLNGGFAKHERKERYRHSRGIIVPAMLEYTDPVAYWNTCDLHDIEPFSIVAFANKKLYHFVWTGNEKHSIQPDPLKPHIWSSSTLYDVPAKNYRLKLFNEFTHSGKTWSKESLLEFFRTATSGDPMNGFIMNRDESVKTCSISMVELHYNKAGFEYHDLLTGTTHHRFLDFIQRKKQPLQASNGLQ